MKYELLDASNDDIDILSKYKELNIFMYALDLGESEKDNIRGYVKNDIPTLLGSSRIIVVDHKKVGCIILDKENDGIIIDEIYLEEDYRSLGIGSSIIKSVLFDNDIVYLWVYKLNEKAIALYQRLGFNIINETETRYYMKYVK